jgi:hypothetical protein
MLVVDRREPNVNEQGFYPSLAGAETAPAAAAPAIAEDTPCRKCGYNLRGLSSDGRCPECGTSVGFSLQGDLLRFCDPGWVETLRRGIQCIIAGVVLAFVAGLGIFVMAVGGRGGPPIWPLIGGAIIIAAMIVATIGWWLLTRPDPSGLGEDQYGTVRKIIRVAQVVGLVQLFLANVTRVTTLDDVTMMAIQAVTIICHIVEAVGIFAECAYLERLARRIPDAQISARAHFLMWALGLTYGVFRLFSVALNLLGWRPVAGQAQGLFCFNGIIALFVLIFFVMFLFMLEKMGKRFKEQALAARQTWAAAPFGQSAPPAVMPMPPA